jgi:hypothetical protein
LGEDIYGKPVIENIFGNIVWSRKPAAGNSGGAY